MVDGQLSIELYTSEMEEMISVRYYDCESESLVFAFPCGLLSLKADLTHRNDLALVRSHRELSRRITKEAASAGLKCKIESWGGAWEVEKILMENVTL